MQSFRQSRNPQKKKKSKQRQLSNHPKLEKVNFFGLTENVCGVYKICFLFTSGRLTRKTNKASVIASQPSRATIGNSTTKSIDLEIIV
jgi:hypothetical protein